MFLLKQGNLLDFSMFYDKKAIKKLEEESRHVLFIFYFKENINEKLEKNCHEFSMLY